MHRKSTVAARTVATVSILSPIALPVFSLKLIMARVARENPAWSQTRLRKAEIVYRQYLMRCKQQSRRRLSPGKDADKVWHAHLLHTQMYAKDCHDYFGYFLHHVPISAEHPRRKKRKDCDGCGGCDCGDIKAQKKPCWGDSGKGSIFANDNHRSKAVRIKT